MRASRKMRVFLFLVGLCFTEGIKLEDEIIQADMITDLGKLVTDLVFKIKSEFCYSMIWDEVYEDVLNVKLFELLKVKPMFVATIPEHEDLLKPQKKTLKMLKEIRKAKCDVYMIFLANGIQVSRLLRYGDRTRVLNTRAKFILLHDYRLFDSSLHYLWRRIINVIFIRQYSQNADISKAGRRFELSTVPFPRPLKEVFVLKVLDYWQAGKYRYNRPLLIDQTKDLVNNTFKAVVFVHTPGVMADESNASSYNGLEIDIINALTVALNFTVEMYEIPDAQQVKWGMVENDTVTGLLGEMNEAKASFALADIYYTSYHLNVMDLSVPYMTECLTFLTPEATSDNSWQTLILPFSGAMWAGVLISLFSVGFVFYGVSFLCSCLQRIEVEDIKAMRDATQNVKLLKPIPQIQKDMFDDFSNCIVYTYSMLLYVSLPNFPRAWSLRMLTGWYWIYCILIVVAYRASMTAILSNPFPRVIIDTISELADSKVAIGIWGQQNKGFFLMSDDSNSQLIGERAEHYTDPIEATKRVSDGSYAFYENEHLLKEMRSKIKSNITSLSLHVMKECAINMPVSIGMEKNSPLKDQVDKYIRRMIESGLISRWLKKSVESFEASREDPPPEALVDLKKLYGALVALGIGYLLGTIALIGELIYWKFYIEKHPMYDKFAMEKFYQNYRKKQPVQIT